MAAGMGSDKLASIVYMYTISRMAVTSVVDIAQSLREALNSGRLPSGAPLRQEELASQFGVSRIPVRDALQKLEAEGLVTILPNRGAFVAQPTIDEVRELFDLRLLLETDVLRRATSNHDARTIRSLEAIQRELDLEDDARRWLDLDQQFHYQLCAPSRRARTLAYIQALRAAVNRFYLVVLTPGSRRKGWSREHHAILKMVADGKATDAGKALATHLGKTADMTLQALTRADHVQSGPHTRRGSRSHQ